MSNRNHILSELGKGCNGDPNDQMLQWMGKCYQKFLEKAKEKALKEEIEKEKTKLKSEMLTPGETAGISSATAAGGIGIGLAALPLGKFILKFFR